MIIRVEKLVDGQWQFHALVPIEEAVQGSAWLTVALRPRLLKDGVVEHYGYRYRQETIVATVVRGKFDYPRVLEGGFSTVEEFHATLLREGNADTIEHVQADLYLLDGGREYHFVQGIEAAPCGWETVAAARVAREQSHAQARKVSPEEAAALPPLVR